MFQVIYEYQGSWPEEGKLDFHGQFMDEAFSGVIELSPTEAKRRVNNYLSREVSLGIFADDPTLIVGKTPRWRLALSLRLPGLETTEIPGSIEINAQIGKIIPLSAERIHLLLDMANDIAGRLALETAAAG